MRLLVLAVLVGSLVCPLGAWASDTAVSKITVVGKTGGEASDYEAYRLSLATTELARYLGEMSGRKVPVKAPTDQVRSKTVLVVGNAAQNALAADLVQRKVVDLTLPSDNRDAFVVRYGKDDHRDYLVFAGANALGTLYAVYHYLEYCCDMGTFMDGEHVPSRKHVPVEGVDIAETPRIRDRHFGYSMGYGMEKYFNQFRSADQMNQLMDWMVKQKMNRTGWGFYAYPGGTESETVFGYQCKPEEDYGAGWPRAWTYAPEYRTKMLQDWFKYARERGIQIYYAMEFGLVPRSYREAHPELPYVGHVGYDANIIEPDSPECLAIMRQYLDEIDRLYGTDHIYQCTPFCESSGAATPEEALDIKLQAARSLCATLAKLDPDYVWQSDSWDFGAVPSVWTQDRIARYFKELTPEHPHMYMYDTASNFWDRTNFFGGIDWAYGILHSFQGDDQLHGDLARVSSEVRRAVNDPGSVHLKGLYHIPESFGHNILYFQFTTTMGWDPNAVQVGPFLEHYCRTRYNAKSYDTMLACTRKVVDAVYSGGGMDMYYQRMGVTYNPGASPPFDDFLGGATQNYSELCREIGIMEDAVKLALEAVPTEDGNQLFENDLVDYSKTMLGLKSNYYLIEAYKDFKKGDSKTFEQNVADTLKCLDGIEAILSTRPDYSIQKTIDDAMAIPGTNPFVPRMIRKHAINDMYAPVENYEELVLFYKPRVEAYFDAMRNKMANGVTTFTRGEMNEPFGKLDQQWWDNECRVPEDKHFKGTTIQAVQAVYDCVPFGVILPAGSVELKQDQVLSCTPDVPSDLRPIPWEDGRIVEDQQAGKPVWRLGEGASAYLYFVVDPGSAVDTKEPAIIAVDYLDEGAGELLLHYDSAGDPYRSVSLAKLGGSGKWKRAEATLSDIRFGKHENGGADFRLCMTGGNIAIARVVVASPHVTALPVFGVGTDE